MPEDDVGKELLNFSKSGLGGLQGGGEPAASAAGGGFT
jgi:hypothetical protein